MRAFTVGLLASCLLAAASPASAEGKLVIWWGKSINKGENDALLGFIKRFEAKTGASVDLSQYTTENVIPKVVSALDAGAPPDVAYVDLFDMQVAGKWAYEGKLDDLSDILLPIKDQFANGVLEQSFLYNDKAKKRAYYAFPVKMQAFHITYWADMLEKAGFKESDIPKGWKDYWSFWCDKVQPAYRKATRTRVYGMGIPLSITSSDTYQMFLPFIDAYDVKLVDASGKPRLDDPSVRTGLIKAMRDWTAPYLKGCVPPSATNWQGPDNNLAQNNRTTIMTVNGTISIAAKWLDDANNTSLPEAEREAAKVNYYQNIRTTGFPLKPDGSVLPNRVSVKIGLVFDQAPNKALARQFVAFLENEENLRDYVEGGFGRWFPITKEGQKSAFWQADSHRKTVYDQITGPTIPYEFIANYKFATLNNENVWGVAMNRIVNDKVPVEQAVDEMLRRMKQVVEE